MPISHTARLTLHKPNDALARLSLLGYFLGKHVEEEARGFAADISRKHNQTEPPALDGLQKGKRLPARSQNDELGAVCEMELAGLEPATSWVRSRRSPN